MAAVMIVADPHKGSYTAAAIDATEELLGELQVRSWATQAGRLVAWAGPQPELAACAAYSCRGSRVRRRD